MGEEAYFRAKLAACIDSGLLMVVRQTPQRLALGTIAPRISYPDGSIRDYQAGLEAAKERLQADDERLRASRFNIHDFVPSVSERPQSLEFQRLVASMREHGFLEQHPVLLSADGSVIDGRARVRAAKTADIQVKQATVPGRRDTALYRALLVLDANGTRLTEDVHTRACEAIAERTRAWNEIESDLELTRAWRLAPPRAYKAQFEVRKVRYRPDDAAAIIQVTKDGDKVMVRSLLEAAGLASYKYGTELAPYVAREDARTPYTTGRAAVFVRVSDAITGIRAMQRDRRTKHLKVDPQWEHVRKWLVSFAARSSKTREESPLGDWAQDTATVGSAR
ncbi:MAG TPA: hypothetical protein VFC51_05970 [Chloroflexota bacterium]|nr:hypothetical protein [Chloroflexota bacterium]